VAVLNESVERSWFDPAQVSYTTTKGHGPGGQKRNKVETAVVAKHRPTGIEAYCQSNVSQHRNKEEATRILRDKVNEFYNSRQSAAESQRRRNQVGSGERSDKIRTIQVSNGIVVDHRTKKKMSYKNYLKGDLRKLK